MRLSLRKEICNIQKALKLTTIMVTHDQDEALTMGDRIIVMNKAVVMQSGTPEKSMKNRKIRLWLILSVRLILSMK